MHAVSPRGHETTSGGRKRISPLIAVSALVICLAAVALWYFTGRHTDTIGSMMVLPFENVGGNADLEYLSDGVTEGIINALAKDQALRVIPRSASFRFKGSAKDPAAIGKELGVDAVLSGRVVQRGNNLDVTTELIDVHAYSQIWGENYHRTMNDLVTVQDDIIGGVRKRINENGSATSVESRQNVDPAAYRLYLQGKFQWNKRTAAALDEAMNYFQQAIVVDPKFALAHLGLSETYVLQGQYADKNSPDILLNAVDEARRALDLDNSLGEAHAALGLIHVYQWKWEDAEREFKLAIEKAPSYATGYQWYYICLSMQGRDEEALTYVQKASEVDPYSPIILSNAAEAYIDRGDYASARSLVQKVFNIDPKFLFARVFMSEILQAEGRPAEGVATLDSISQAGLSSNNLAFLSYHYASLGETTKAKAILDRLIEQDKRGVVDPLNLALAYTGLGEKEMAIKALQRGFDQHSASGIKSITLLPEIRHWHEFRPLLSDPRVQKILRGMGLPLLKG
jgi:TolB-like protein/tetratricopeptide (TPR) repeat protein